MEVVIYILRIAVIAILLYLIMIMPRMFHRPDRTPYCSVLYAHRGLFCNDSDAPENSMLAFKKAVEAGYGIEMDIQLTKDKIPVVFHDFTLDRMCGVKGKVEEYTYEELQQFRLAKSEQTIPRFEDVLREVDGKVPLLVEFKIEGVDLSLCPIADALLREYKGIYCMESFNPLGVRWYRKNRPEVFRGQLAESFWKESGYHGILYVMLSHLLFNFLARPDFIAFNHKQYKAVSRSLCRKLFHCTSAAWTLKSNEDLKHARKEFDIFIFDSFIPE